MNRFTLSVEFRAASDVRASEVAQALERGLRDVHDIEVLDASLTPTGLFARKERIG